MSNIFKNNKIIIVIILASFFQLVSFVLSQIVVNIDEELEKINYKIISNEIKLDDLDLNIRHVLPDLLVLAVNHQINLQIYNKYYSNHEYDQSLIRIVNHIDNYLKFIEKDFFIDHDLKLNDFDKSNINMQSLKMFQDSIFNVIKKLEIFEKQIIDKGLNLKIKHDHNKNVRHLMNVGLIATQILNLFFLSLFFLFAFENYKKRKVLKE